MFCENCGKQIPDGQKLCPECAGQQTQQPTTQVPGYDVSMPNQGGGKKLSGGKIALIVIALVLVVGLILTIINWSSIMLYFKRNFAEPTEYLTEVEALNAASAAHSIAQQYEAALEVMEVSNGKGAVKTELSLELGDEVTTMLETLMAQEGLDMDMDWLSSLTATITTNKQDSLQAFDVALGVNNTTLLTLSVILDMENLEMYLAIPELNETYLVMDMAAAADMDPEELQANLEQSLDMAGQLLEILPSGDELEDMITNYITIVLEYFEDAEKANETVTVAGVKQDLLVLTVELSQKDVLNIALDILEEAKTDKTIQKMLVGLADYAGVAGELVDLQGEYASAVDMAIAEVEALKADASGKSFLTLETYVDDEDMIVGRSVELSADGQSMEAHYIMVTDGKKFVLEADVDGAFTVEGSGTLDDGFATGKFLLSAMGEDYLTLELEKMGQNKEGILQGKLAIRPEAALLSEMGVDSSLAGMAGAVSIELTLQGEQTKVGLLAAKEVLVAVGVKSTQVSASDITLPKNGVYIEDPESSSLALLSWAAGLKVDTVLANMEEAGIPAELLESLAGMLVG